MRRVCHAVTIPVRKTIAASGISSRFNRDNCMFVGLLSVDNIQNFSIPASGCSGVVKSHRERGTRVSLAVSRAWRALQGLAIQFTNLLRIYIECRLEERIGAPDHDVINSIGKLGMPDQRQDEII